jgi:hypothetical protein
MDIAIFELAAPAPPAADEEPKKASTIDKIKNTIMPNTSAMETSEEKVSANAKVVVLGLFALVAFVVGIFAWVSVASDGTLSDAMIAVFTAAVTGILTLGGTMVQQLWGK